MGNRIPDGYITVKVRVKKFLEKNGVDKSAITTEVIHCYPAEGAAIIKATISVSGVVKSTGHALADLEEDKGLEKGETVAIGRALEFAGEDAVAEEDNGSEPKSEPPSEKKSGKFGKSNSRLGKLTSKRDGREEAPAQEESSETQGAEEEQQEETTSNDSGPAEQETPPEKRAEDKPRSSPGGSKMSDLMQKYGNQPKSGSTSNLRR